MHKPVCDHEDVTVLENQGLHTDREIAAKRPVVVIKNKKEKICILIHVTTPAEENATKKEAEKKLIREFMYRDTTNVELEMYDYTNSNWSHWNSNGKFKEKFGSCTGKTLDIFTTKDSYTCNITHNTESTAV